MNWRPIKCGFCGLETNNSDKLCNTCWEVIKRLKGMPPAVVNKILIYCGHTPVIEAPR